MGRVGPRPPDVIATEHPTITEMRKRLEGHKREYIRQCELIDRQLYAVVSTDPSQRSAVSDVRASYDVSPYGWSDTELAKPLPVTPSTTWDQVKVGGTD